MRIALQHCSSLDTVPWSSFFTAVRSLVQSCSSPIRWQAIQPAGNSASQPSHLDTKIQMQEYNLKTFTNSTWFLESKLWKAMIHTDQQACCHQTAVCHVSVLIGWDLAGQNNLKYWNTRYHKSKICIAKRWVRNSWQWVNFAGALQLGQLLQQKSSAIQPVQWRSHKLWILYNSSVHTMRLYSFSPLDRTKWNIS